MLPVVGLVQDAAAHERRLADHLLADEADFRLEALRPIHRGTNAAGPCLLDGSRQVLSLESHEPSGDCRRAL